MIDFTKISLFLAVVATSVAVAMAQTGTTATGSMLTGATSTSSISVQSVTATGTTSTGTTSTGTTLTGATLTGANIPEKTEVKMCTAEYNPVCAIPAGAGVTAKMYSNSCSASVADAKIVDMAQCVATPVTGKDNDKYGCQTSAGYSWDETLAECVRPNDISTIFAWSKKVGLTTTPDVTAFAPERNISREEVTAIVERSFTKKLFTEKQISGLAELTFDDKDAIASEFISSVKFAKSANIVRGNGTKFFPKNSISNYEILLILARSVSADVNISNPEAEKLVKTILGSLVDDKKFLDAPAKRSDVFAWIKRFVEYQKNNKITHSAPIENLTSGTWRLDYIVSRDGKNMSMPDDTSLIVSKTGFSAQICNILNGEIVLTDSEIRLSGHIIGTKMYCGDANLNYAEQHFMNKKAEYSFSMNNKILTIASDTGVKYVFSRK